MFLRRMATSALVLAVLSCIGLSGNSRMLAQERAELAYNNRNLIRLHILANSDRPTDQSIKLKVRDAILAETRRLFLGVDEPARALSLARKNQAALASLAGRIAMKAGARYGARVQIGTYSFPTRVYPFGTLPAGRYQAVRIILGRGQGHNWWCVLFPPLCFLAPAGQRVTGPVRIRLLFLERLLHNNGLALNAFWRGWAGLWRLSPRKA